MSRAEILDVAKRTICNDRNDQYGEPEDNFKMIADLWGDYLHKKLSAEDVANMMILFKVARNVTGSGKMDNWIDICGYAACGGEIAEKNDRSKIISGTDLSN